MTVRVATLAGRELAQGLPALARLRIAVFRDWPYLYDGTLTYEEKYLARFAAAAAIDRSAGAAGVFAPAEHGLSETGVLADGALDRPQWVYAEVDLARLRQIKAAGEMRNSTDWSAQPGAAPLASHAEVVPLA